MPRTLREIAAAANVSVSTASRALNGHPAISPETMTRVHQAAEELRYHQRRSHGRLDARRRLAHAAIGVLSLGMDRSLLALPDDVDGRRFRDRVRLHAALDRQAEEVARLPAAQGMGSHYDKAFQLLGSPATQWAFRLGSEPDRTRGRYGWHHFGQSCLLARRLVEAGVPLVTVFWNTGAVGAPGNWDTHNNNAERLKTVLLPPFERAYSALLEDLHGRGLLDETLVVWMGEFGRTPKINKNAGRDHWGFCQSVLLAGGGVRGGQVYGSSDASAAYAAELPVSPDDLAATVFDRLGIRLDHELIDAQGRPLPLCTGKPIERLFS